jgi:membrane protein implicated in regulation of membrane protease activity
MMQINTDPFPMADLETNRSGRLTDAQRKKLSGAARAGRKDEFIAAVFCAGIGVVLLAAPGLNVQLWLRVLAGLGFLLVAVMLVRAAVGGDSLTKDLRSGRVERIEGAIGKRSRDVEGEHSHWTDYYIEVAGKSFSVDGATFRAAPDAGYVALFILPRSNVILNLERLPDRPLPAGAISSPAATMAAATNTFSAMLSQDPTREAEAKARLASMEHAMDAQMAGAAVRPPAGQLDSGPLAQTIVGTWQNGFMAMAFMPDGTMVATLPGGHQKSGRWSIGSDGRLHSSTAGHDRGSEAWVVGDVLTISEDGRGMAYQRSPSS